MTATTRERLREAIRSTNGNGHIPTEDETVALALKLSTEFQQSGLTVDAIVDEIKAVASGKSNGLASGQ